MSKHTCSKGKNKRTITQISDKEYLVEGEADWIRFGCQFDLSFITSANIQNGPFLLIGDTFLGKGRIVQIQNLSDAEDDDFIIKVTIEPIE